MLRAWLAENAGSGPTDPLFPTSTGTRLSRDAIEHRLAVHLATAPRTAARRCATKHATMHTLRHTAAMRLRHAGVDIAVIALWLGHEQMATVQHLPARRHGPRKNEPSPESPRPARQARPLPAARPATRLPRQPSDYADRLDTPIPADQQTHAGVGITLTSA